VLPLTSACSQKEEAAPAPATNVPNAPAPTLGATTTAAPGGTSSLSTTMLPVNLAQVVTAKGCEVEVVAEKGAGPSGTPICDGTPPPTQPKIVEPQASGNGATPGLPEIPRVGLNSAGARRTPLGWAYTNPTYFKGPLTFLVTQNEGEWLKVLLPARPNRSEGWVRSADVTTTVVQHRIELDLSDFHLVAYNGNDVIADTKVVIGTAGTPTPVGRFFVNDKVQQSYGGGSYGPWVLSTNGYSDALDLFDNGLPVIGFHGTNQPGLIGTRASNGCVRMPNDVVSKLAAELPLGTPITITE